MRAKLVQSKGRRDCVLASGVRSSFARRSVRRYRVKLKAPGSFERWCTSRCAVARRSLAWSRCARRVSATRDFGWATSGGQARRMRMRGGSSETDSFGSATFAHGRAIRGIVFEGRLQQAILSNAFAATHHISFWGEQSLWGEVARRRRVPALFVGEIRSLVLRGAPVCRYGVQKSLLRRNTR